MVPTALEPWRWSPFFFGSAVCSPTMFDGESIAHRALPNIYRSGVVLPLSHRLSRLAGSPSILSSPDGAAQAVSRTLFTFAADLGAAAIGYPNVLAGAALGLIGIFSFSFSCRRWRFGRP
jgi:hypothetical protein